MENFHIFVTYHVSTLVSDIDKASNVGRGYHLAGWQLET